MFVLLTGYQLMLTTCLEWLAASDVVVAVFGPALVASVLPLNSNEQPTLIDSRNYYVEHRFSFLIFCLSSCIWTTTHRRSPTSAAFAPSRSQRPVISSRTCTCTAARGPSSATSVPADSPNRPTWRITYFCIQVSEAASVERRIDNKNNTTWCLLMELCHKLS